MSNLLKQYYVVRQEDKKCVINSNSLAEERIRSLGVGTQMPKEAKLTYPGEPAAADSFSGGIVAEKVEVPPEPDPKEVAAKILSEAREQADNIMNEANVQAKLVLEEAREQAQILREEQQALGYSEGREQREAELAELERSLEEQQKQLMNEVEQKKTELESEFEMRMEEMETDIVDALIPVFEKVFHVQFAGKREILLALIGNTLMNVETGNKVKIRTNEADKKMLMEHLEEIRELTGADVSVELVQDIKLKDGQCQLETNYGVFDCGIDTHFDNLIRDIRSLV